MPFLKLTPLQSRFAASLAASIVVLVLYLSLTKPHFAYAIDLDSRIPSEDHNHYMIFDSENQDVFVDGEYEGGENKIFDPEEQDVFVDGEYEGGKNKIFGRAEVGVSALANNAPQNKNINIGETQNWVFTKDAVNGPHGTTGPGLPSDQLTKKRDIPSLDISEFRRRQDGNTVYITLNTCLQPSSNATGSDSNNTTPPQLEMYISLSESNQKPGPGSDDPNQQTIQVNGGYAIFTGNTNSDVYVGVSAPNTTAFGGIWNYEVAASIDEPFHVFQNTSNLIFVDSDNHAVLLVTNNTTRALPNETVYQEWMNLSPPWGVFATNQNDSAILGIQNSFCGLKHTAQIVANLAGFNNQNVAQMTNRGLGGEPKEQFYIAGLNASSKYWGMLAMEGNSTASGTGVVGGGGTVWAPIQFETKTENNCALLYNLSFCTEVAYAVPTNPDKFSPITELQKLAEVYDSYASQFYQYFNYSLQQIQCNASSSEQFSLARNCDDCARAYKAWLCAVTIPRCADYSSTLSWLQPRNLGQPFVNGSSISAPQFHVDQTLLNAVASNSSRNPNIDALIAPGPYKEVLPCVDLCYDLMQSCPASLGFACPLSGAGLEQSYGTRVNQSAEVPSCNYLGAAYYLSRAETFAPLGVRNMVLLAFVAVLMNLS